MPDLPENTNSVEQVTTSLSLIKDKLVEWVDLFIYYLPNVILAIIVFGISIWLSRKVENSIDKLLTPIIKKKSIRGLVAQVISVLFLFLGLMLALSILNLDGALKSLLAGAGIAGLAVGLALQGSLSNTVSGVLLTVDEVIQVGDWIESSGYAGEVVDVGLRSTTIKEADNNLVILPNKTIIEVPLKNYSVTDTIKTSVKCSTSYDTSLEKVKEVAINAIANKFPKTSIEDIDFFYTDFADSGIEFTLRLSVRGKNNYTTLEVKSLAIMAIKEAFEEAGISIPYPTRVIKEG